jgi:hypothetical protein
MQFDPRYKPRQFGKDSLAAGVSGNEYFESMQYIITPGRTRRWIPAFYSNDAQLRAVLAKAVINYSFHGARVPENLSTDLANLQRLATEQQVRVENSIRYWNATIEHLNAVRNVGSYVTLLAAISYRAWRLGWHDKDIAESVGLTRRGVTEIIGRLVLYGKEMGFETYATRKGGHESNCDYVAVVALWTAGMSTNEIAKELRCHRRSVRHTLRLAGVYVMKRRCGCGVPLKQKKNQRGCPECDKKRGREYMRFRREQAWLKTVAWG